MHLDLAVKTLAMSIKEGAESAQVMVPTTNQQTNDTSFFLILQIIVSILPIIIAIVFNMSVKSKIRQKENFNGISWGVANSLGAGAIGLLCVVLAHNSINKELNKVKDKKYTAYAKDELRRFIKSYAICCIVVIIISVLLLSN